MEKGSECFPRIGKLAKTAEPTIMPRKSLNFSWICLSYLHFTARLVGCGADERLLMGNRFFSNSQSELWDFEESRNGLLSSKGCSWSTDVLQAEIICGTVMLTLHFSLIVINYVDFFNSCILGGKQLDPGGNWYRQQKVNSNLLLYFFLGNLKIPILLH